MNQIILNGILLPQASFDKYACWEEVLSVQKEMISGRMIMETRGKIWRISYAYDYMGNELMRMALAVLRSGAPFIATALPDNSDETITTSFICTRLDPPKMAFSRKDNAYWHKIGFELREERPH